MVAFGALIFARMGSQRLPGKTLKEVEPGLTLLDLVVARARQSRRLDFVGIATGDTAENDAIEAACKKSGYPCFRGSEEDVLGRGLAAARYFDIEHVLWLTGDNPFIEGRLIDDCFDFYRQGEYDYLATTHMGHSDKWQAERTFPRGVSIQIMPTWVLERIDPLTTDPLDRENGTFTIYNRPDLFRLGAFEAKGPYASWRHPELRLTIDTPEDWALLTETLRRLALSRSVDFSSEAAISLLAADPLLAALNADIHQRQAKEGALK